MLFMLNSDHLNTAEIKTYQTRQHFSNLGETVLIQEWSSAAAATSWSSAYLGCNKLMHMLIAYLKTNSL